MGDWIAVLGLAAAAALWAVVQRWAAHADPHNPGVKRDCGGTCNSCDRSCDE